MATKGQIVFRVVMILVGLLVVAAASGVWLVWKKPLTVHAWFGRAALGKAGLSQTTVAGPAGPINVFVGGEGPTLVLLHGAGDQAGAWGRIAGQLVGGHRLVVPDLPGHWKSEPRSGPISIGTILAGVEAVVGELAGESAVILMGNSLGGWVGTLYARQHPERVARLILVNGGPLREENPAVNLFPQNRDEARKTMDGLTGPATLPVPDYVLDDIVRHAQHGPAGRLAQTADEMEGWLLDGRLDEVVTPVDLIWGEADELLSLEYANRLLEGFPAARLRTLPKCGHVPQVECPVHLVEALSEVLALAPPEAAPADEGEEGAASADAVE